MEVDTKAEVERIQKELQALQAQFQQLEQRRGQLMIEITKKQGQLEFLQNLKEDKGDGEGSG